MSDDPGGRIDWMVDHPWSIPLAVVALLLLSLVIVLLGLLLGVLHIHER